MLEKLKIRACYRISMGFFRLHKQENQFPFVMLEMAADLVVFACLALNLLPKPLSTKAAAL